MLRREIFSQVDEKMMERFREIFDPSVTFSERGDQTATRCQRGNPTVSASLSSLPAGLAMGVASSHVLATPYKGEQEEGKTFFDILVYTLFGFRTSRYAMP